MKKRFKSKRRKASKKGLGHQAAKATSEQAVTNCSISFLSDWKELMAGGIGEQEIHPVQTWQRPRDLSSEHLHMQVTAQWHTTDSQQKLFTLEISPGNGNDHPGTQWPTTKAMSVLITWLFHWVINLFRKLLGRKLLDSSPLVLAGEIFTGQGAQVIWKNVAPQKSQAAQGDWRCQKQTCYAESCLTSEETLPL